MVTGKDRPLEWLAFRLEAKHVRVEREAKHGSQA